MHLGGIVLAIQMVLTGGVEVELRQLEGLVVEADGAVGDDLERAAQVEELSAVRIRVDVEPEAASLDRLVGARADVDGRLLLPLGALGVGRLVQSVPVQGPADAVEAKVGHLDRVAAGTGEEGRPMVAEGRDSRQKHRHDAEDISHFERKGDVETGLEVSKRV